MTDTPMPPPDIAKRVKVDPSTGHVNVELLPEEVLRHVPPEVLETATAKAHAEALSTVLVQHARGAGALPEVDHEADAEQARAERILAAPKARLAELLDAAELPYPARASKRTLAMLVSEAGLEP